MKVAKEIPTLKAQIGPGGEVHCADGTDRARGSGMPASEFAASAAGRVVRVLASQENVGLVVALYQDGVTVELGRPPGTDWAAAADIGPHTTIHEMRQAVATAPCRGGWHVMTALDYPTYAMADVFARSGPEVDRELLEDLFAAHPAGHALTFIPHLDRMKVCRLLATVLDPRWYIDPDRPNSVARLKIYLGLVPGRRGRSVMRSARRSLVSGSWRTTPGVPRKAGDPGYFLWRHFATCDGTPEQAYLKTDFRFLAYLRSVWLDSLYPTASRLFVPEYFFRDVKTSDAWRAWNNTIKVNSTEAT